MDLFLSKEIIGKRVLIVDSNIKSSQWLARLLKPTQAEITQVGEIDNLDEFLDPQKSGQTFDVVLVNNNVKGFRRVDDLIGIKKRFPSEAIKVVYLTDTVQFAQRVSEAGVGSIDSVLIKPINASQLHDTWITIFGGKTKQKKEYPTKKTASSENLFNGVRILLVEDNEINQEVIQELLKQHGAQIKIADNGRKALDLLERQVFDLVLMDIQMPIMDGFTAAEEIRKNARFTSLPIIALTANAQIEERNLAEKTGMNDYITKPIEPRLLFEIIAKWIGKNISDENLVARIDATQPFIIEGVNTSKGLERLNNDYQEYLVLLNKFVKNHQEDFQKIENYILQGVWDTVISASHAIRGVAGNLGAIELMGSLANIEAAAKIKDSNTALEELKRARKIFESIALDIQTINKKFNEKIPGEKNTYIDQKDLLVQLKKLEGQIKNNNPDAKILIKEINQGVSPVLFDGLLINIQVSLEAYNFKQAQNEVRKIIKMIKGDIEHG